MAVTENEIPDIYVMSSINTISAILDDYESCIWTDRYNEAGDFEIYMPVSTKRIQELQVGYYLWRKDSDSIMVIEKVQIDTSFETGDHLTITGRSYESVLDRRIIWDTTAFESSSFQNGILQLLNDACISPSVGDRKISNLSSKTSTDTRITDLTWTVQYQGDNLYDVIVQACQERDIGWCIQRSGDTGQGMVFELYAGVDRTYSGGNLPVVFSYEYENLISSSYLKTDINVKNVARIAGGTPDPDTNADLYSENGSGQIMTETGSGSGLNRRELFVDSSSQDMQYEYTYTDDNDEEQTAKKDYTLSQYKEFLVSDGETALSETKTDLAYEGDVDPYRQFEYGVDYTIGDLVQIVDRYGNEDVVRITEVVRTHDTSGYTIVPTFTSTTSTD